MKKIAFAFSLFCLQFGFAQLVTTNIDFNNYISPTDNDLVNNFKIIAPIDYEVVAYGSGYNVKTPLQGTMVLPLVYCSKYQGIDNETMKISIDFRYEYWIGIDESIAVGIGLYGENNNGILGTSISQRKLYIAGLIDMAPNDFPMGVGSSYFPDYNWYRLLFEVTKIETGKYLISSKIYKLGFDGLSSPILMGTLTKTGYNYNFGPDKRVTVRIAGGKRGDVTHLDNFSIYGFKNGTACPNLSTKEIVAEKKNIYPNPTSNYINFDAAASKVELYSLTGALINIFDYPNGKIDISHVDKGMYVLKIYTKNGIVTEKIIKQ